MHEGGTIFTQVMDTLSRYEFEKCVAKYRGDYRARTLSCYQQFLIMGFAQLTFRESLRDIEFQRLHRIQTSSAFFVTCAKQNFQCRRRYSRPVDKSTGLRFDQTVVLTGYYSHQQYPDPLRRIGYFDAITGKSFVFHSNNFIQPAIIIASLPLPLAGRIVLQMDQTTSSHQSVLRHITQCCENASLDCYLDLCARSHYAQAPQPVAQSLHNITNFEPATF